MERKHPSGTFRRGSLFLGVLLAGASSAYAEGVTYHGRLLKPDGTSVEASQVDFRIQILTPSDSDCLMFAETQRRNMSGTKGVFALTIGDGNAISANTEPFTIQTAFLNNRSLSFPAGKCVDGTSSSATAVTLGAAASRQLKVSFNDGSFSGWEPLPAQTINHVPLAMESVSVGGYQPGNFFRVETAGVPQNMGAWSVANYTKLTDLIANTTISGGNASIGGNAAGFTGSLSGDVTGGQGTTKVEKIQNRNVLDVAPTHGQVLTWNNAQTRWEPAPVPAAGNPDWSDITNRPASLPPNGSAGGDLAGSSYPAPVIANNAITSAKINDGTINGVDLDFTGANGATSSFVMKDSSGKFSNFACTTPGHVPSWTMSGFACQALSPGGLAYFTESLVTTAPNATVPVVGLLATNPAMDIDVALSPKGGGALTAHSADGTAVGGNKRGQGAVDWQMKRNSATEVASGTYSAALGGHENTASGWASITLGGYVNTASMESSAALGGGDNTAGGMASVVLGGQTNAATEYAAAVLGGENNKAAGIGSVVLGGRYNSTSGVYSVATGYQATADSYSQVTVGRFNMPTGSEDANDWVATDPLVVVGNGTGSGVSRSNALVILKNGDVGIGTSSPGSKLHVDGKIRAQEICDEVGSNCKDISTGWGGGATSVSGDVSGAFTSTTVDAIKGKSVVPAAYSTGQVLRYDGTNWVNTLLSLSADVTGTLPVARGGTGATSQSDAINNLLPSQTSNAGRILQTNGTIVSWVDAPATGITALTGDVTASGSGSVVATIANGAVTSTKIQDGTIVGQDLDFTGLNTATSTLMVKDSAGRFYNFGCTTSGHVPAWTATGFACQAPSETDPQVGANTTNMLSKWDGSALVASGVYENGGNVGIGTTNPSEKLSVSGGIVATGKINGGVSTDSDSLNSITLDFSNLNTIRATGSSAACGTLNFTNVSPGGIYTVTIPNASATCVTVQMDGSAAAVRLPFGYAGGEATVGVVYTAIHDGTTLWVSYIPF